MVGIKGHYTVGGIGTVVPPPVALSTPFPVTSLTVVNPIVLPRPNYLEEIVDTSFGYRVGITRVSGSSTEEPTYFPLNTGSAYVFDHGYNTRQAWSRNGSTLKLGNRTLIDAVTRIPFKYLDTSYKLWSNVDDDKLYCFYKAGYCRIFRRSLNTYEATNLFDLRGMPGFDALPDMQVGYFEGNISNDDSRVIVNPLINGERRNILMNLQTGTVIWDKSNNDFNTGVDGMNNITVSKSANYILTTRYPLGYGSGSETPLVKQAYDMNGNLVTANLGDYSHREVQFGADGTEYMIGTNPPMKANIATGQITSPLVPLALMEAAWKTTSTQVHGGHSSGRCDDLRDWLLHSSNTDLNRYREILFVKMDGSGNVMRVCDSRTTPGAINAQGTPSWDGGSVLYASNWNNANGPTDAYVARYLGPLIA